MRKLHLPATVQSVFYKSMGLVKVKLEDPLPDSGWDALAEVAEANGMAADKLCALYEPFVFNEFAEFKSSDVDMNDVEEIAERCS